MTRLRSLKGPAKYIAWSLTGLILGLVYVLLTTPFFESGPIWSPPVFGLIIGITQAFYARRRDRSESPWQPWQETPPTVPFPERPRDLDAN